MPEPCTPAGTAGWASQRAGFLDHLETFDLVANLDVGVVLERHAALEAGRDLAHLVLEAAQGLERALVDHDAVAQQPDLVAALDDALGDAATRDVADLGDVEHLADLGVAQEVLANLGRQHAAE